MGSGQPVSALASRAGLGNTLALGKNLIPQSSFFIPSWLFVNMVRNVIFGEI